MRWDWYKVDIRINEGLQTKNEEGGGEFIHFRKKLPTATSEFERASDSNQRHGHVTGVQGEDLGQIGAI